LELEGVEMDARMGVAVDTKMRIEGVRVVEKRKAEG
jgi:hypothetical protein